ncbi:MAG: MarR family transcriptional regulator [Streptosporangiales bacterium]|nr:MarR family transcriptional regulator [Streptosporangiales bacterium]
MASQERAARATDGSTVPLTITRQELLVDGSDVKFRELVHDMLALGARHEAVRNGHASYIGLSGAQYTTLVTIRHLQDTPATVRLIAEHLHVSPTFVTAETNKLQRSGLITKTRSKTDSRAVNLAVTPAGHQLLAELAPAQRRVNDEQFAELTAEEFHELHRLVRRLVRTSDNAIARQRVISSRATQPNVKRHP